jgi:hypothetical protein
MDNHPQLKKGSLLHGSDAAGAMFERGREAPGGCGSPRALTPGPACNRSGDLLSLGTARSLAAGEGVTTA